jgi:hypothetical protein
MKCIRPCCHAKAKQFVFGYQELYVCSSTVTNYSPYPSGFFSCQFQRSLHIVSRSCDALKPSSASANAGSAVRSGTSPRLDVSSMLKPKGVPIILTASQQSRSGNRTLSPFSWPQLSATRSSLSPSQGCMPCIARDRDSCRILLNQDRGLPMQEDGPLRGP